MYKKLALLRGINVGGNNKVEMLKLAQLFSSLGFAEVKTYINSGNVILFATENSNALQDNIEKAIHKSFGFEVKVLIRDAENILNICEAIPASWKNDSEQKTDVLFLWKDFDSEKTLEKIEQNPEVDKLIYTDGCIVWNVQRSNYTKSGMNKFIGSTVYKNMTARNINTVRKLGELMR